MATPLPNLAHASLSQGPWRSPPSAHHRNIAKKSFAPSNSHSHRARVEEQDVQETFHALPKYHTTWRTPTQPAPPSVCQFQPTQPVHPKYCYKEAAMANGIKMVQLQQPCHEQWASKGRMSCHHCGDGKFFGAHRCEGMGLTGMACLSSSWVLFLKMYAAATAITLRSWETVGGESAIKSGPNVFVGLLGSQVSKVPEANEHASSGLG